MWLFSPVYQIFSITFASLFPIAAITYSLMYGINNKKKINTRQKLTQISEMGGGTGSNKFRTTSMGSVLDFVDQLADEADDDEDDEIINTGDSHTTHLMSRMGKISHHNNLKLQTTADKKNQQSQFIRESISNKNTFTNRNSLLSLSNNSQ